MENKIKLSPKKIVNKQFQIDSKGYNANEVDYFLDVVVADYENFAAMLNRAYDEIDTLQKTVSKLKAQVQSYENNAKAESAKNIESQMESNVDLLKRLSELEKEVYSKKSE